MKTLDFLITYIHFIREMLAYVFWHQRARDFPANEYESSLLNFHDYFNKKAKIEGYLGSLVVKVDHVPWIEGEVYEDWYFIETSKTLDLLNDIILESNDIKAVHDSIAKIARNGKGGLYKLLNGEQLSPSYRFGYWISKPVGMRYEDFYTEIKPFSQNLWRKQLAMGPLSEFCIFSNEYFKVPEKYFPVYQQRILLYSSVLS
ncbi:conserved hypothetical protein [Sulfolobus islandicus L.S.2.15]|uniref:Uncharacterized protein n=1 Tax=Saccharolobus islandicus (strain L.S.2.15 / Lassen \|nr:conserved hypothetical protein [Sulfolobus islandicus L.S.2.15]